jgi:virginiamycin B lyase
VPLTQQPSRWARPSPTIRVGVLALLIASLISWSLAPAARAEGHVYWAWGTNTYDPAPSGVGRANLDGTGVDQSFITFHGNPRAVAVDGAHVYWLNTDYRGSTIGRAKLDGTGVEPSFITDVGFPPYDLAVGDAHIYWAYAGGIGRANLDGTGVEPRIIEPPRDIGWIRHFFGVAVSGANIYWAFQELGYSAHIPSVAEIRSIGCANLDGTGANYGLVTANAFDMALDAAHVYWTTSIGIGRANLDGTAAQEGFIPTPPGPPGPNFASGIPRVAVDAAHVYWNGGAGGDIGRANLDGSGVEQTLIAGVGARDVAVDGPPPGSPGTSSCPPPDNSFSLGKLKRNLDKGTAKLTVKFPGPGKLRLRKTKRVQGDTEQVAGAGKVRLTVRPRPKAQSKLADTGKVNVGLHVRYTPTRGEPNTESKRVTLKLRRR